MMKQGQGIGVLPVFVIVALIATMTIGYFMVGSISEPTNEPIIFECPNGYVPQPIAKCKDPLLGNEVGEGLVCCNLATLG